MGVLSSGSTLFAKSRNAVLFLVRFPKKGALNLHPEKAVFDEHRTDHVGDN
jgi:hypothetical protein